MASKTEKQKLEELQAQMKKIEEKVSRQKEKIQQQYERSVDKNLKEIRKIIESTGIDLGEDSSVNEVKSILCASQAS